MADAFIGQIQPFAFDFAPRGWAQCAGQILAISQNQALFSLLGTTFGGNGVTTFALPDLRGRLSVGQGHGSGLMPYIGGQLGGEENHTLLVAETPPHTHTVAVAAKADTAKNTEIPGKTVVLSTTTGASISNATLTISLYGVDASPNQAMDQGAVSSIGGQPHENRMPYLGVNFCICLQGIFPTRN